MEWVSWFWNEIVVIPVLYLEGWFNLDLVTSWKLTAWKVGVILVTLFVTYEVYLRVHALLRKYYFDRDNDDLSPDEERKLAASPQFNNDLNAVRGAVNSIPALKREKDWPKVAEVYASLGKHKEAARYYKKAGNPKKAAMEMARAGKTLEAAKLLMKAGEPATAARFFAEKGKHLQAAQAYAAGNDLPNAGNCYGIAGKFPEAVKCFVEYFANARDGAETQLKAAELCAGLLESEKAKAAIGADDRKRLAKGVAERFDAAQRNEHAIKYFHEAGDLVRAGQVYLRIGRLEEAARCMQQAGRNKEAAEIGARFYESKGLWREAGMAYEGAGEFRKAGDCFSRANEAERAADCFEKAGEYFGAGFARVHAKKWAEAIPMFQRVGEDNKNFAESRMLLGRCFYQLKDHAHCVAALENHLTGEKVTSKNIDYFWMLALACEQIGELEKSRTLLQRIRTVDMSYRDVSQRLSSVESRISLAPKMGSAMQGQPMATPGDANAVMTMVSNAVGTRYRLDKELGRGGMGVVYQAHDTQLDRPVALKFLGSLIDGSEEYKKRFQREAQAAARLNHPNIISIFDFSLAEGNTFIVMEYIDGPNLHKYLQRKGKLEPREAVTLIGQACSALDAVHEAGIVHRDIKPENILIAKGGLVKLMDFGLAKAGDMRLTAANVVMGTPCYMSPEQVRGDEVDARSDLYAMGLVLHEMLTGQTTFIDGDVLQRQLKEMPKAPGEIVEGIPPMLDQIVMKCIAKKREERFQTAKELVGYLRQVGK